MSAGRAWRDFSTISHAVICGLRPVSIVAGFANLLLLMSGGRRAPLSLSVKWNKAGMHILIPGLRLVQG
jgi:hypothetical protein